MFKGMSKKDFWYSLGSATAILIIMYIAATVILSLH